jgi:hypothetical protein
MRRNGDDCNAIGIYVHVLVAYLKAVNRFTFPNDAKHVYVTPN